MCFGLVFQVSKVLAGAASHKGRWSFDLAFTQPVLLKDEERGPIGTLATCCHHLKGNVMDKNPHTNFSPG